MKIFNSLSRSIQTFTPLNNKTVKIYVCGITPYDVTHLGHAFTYVFFDTLIRYLKYKGYKVNYVQNVTDIDDDILKKAKELGKNWKKLGEYWTKKFLDDMKSLNVEPPTHFVKATDSITMMIRIIEVLIKKGFAYERKGNVYFEVKKFKAYGELSKFTKKQMFLISKQRGADPNDPLKKNPLDFLLWQKSKKNEPFWESPWGRGRPGWHIECSAMIYQYLGERIDPFGKLRVNGEHSRTIDIHGGGRDLIYPHHECEIAQSESFTAKIPFVKYWMHNAMVMNEGEKMSKSLGNLVLISDLLKKYSWDAVRLYILSHRYRNPWEYDESKLEYYQKEIKLIRNALKKESMQVPLKNNFAKKYLDEFNNCLENDANTESGLLVISNIARSILNKKEESLELQKTLKTCLEILGL
ncbi:MAG: cysteine--tRNA ligase [Candidatus Levybacteria bacterium]|nr:cysteine--tRNA ligase [Candidatus Levybacteria bacterium]